MILIDCKFKENSVAILSYLRYFKISRVLIKINLLFDLKNCVMKINFI